MRKGETYEGTFEDGLMHGEGVLIKADGSSFRGSWDRGKTVGRGAYRLIALPALCRAEPTSAKGHSENLESEGAVRTGKSSSAAAGFLTTHSGGKPRVVAIQTLL